MNEPRTAHHLLRLFPDRWRSRYGEEFTALLAQTGISVGVVFDVLLAAVDARLNSNITPRRWPLMIQQLRRSELAVFAAWVTLAVAGLAFAKLNEDNPFTAMRASQLAVALSYDVVIVAAVVAFLALVVAGVPIALAIALDGLRRRRSSQLALLCVPAIALLVWVGLAWAIVGVAAPGVADPMRIVFFLAVTGGFVVAVAIGAVALGAAALNAHIDGNLYQRAVLPAYVTVAGMFAVTVAVASWGGAMLAADPTAFWGFQGLLSTSTAISWFAIVAVMFGATVVAVRSAVRLHREQITAA